MTKPVNSKDKPSPTKKPVDEGGNAKIRKPDKKYEANEPHKGDIAKRHETEEQPVLPVKDAPKQ